MVIFTALLTSFSKAPRLPESLSPSACWKRRWNKSSCENYYYSSNWPERKNEGECHHVDQMKAIHERYWLSFIQIDSAHNEHWRIHSLEKGKVFKRKIIMYLIVRASIPSHDSRRRLQENVNTHLWQDSSRWDDTILVEISRSEKLSDYVGIDIIAFLQDGQNAKVQVSSHLNTCKISADTGPLVIGTLFFESCAIDSVVSSTFVHIYVSAVFPCLNLPDRSSGHRHAGKQQQRMGCCPPLLHGCCCCRITTSSSSDGGLGWVVGFWFSGNFRLFQRQKKKKFYCRFRDNKQWNRDHFLLSNPTPTREKKELSKFFMSVGLRMPIL